ncbi:neuromusculin isoform 3-T4 [Cochliomyia hominivorax]
MLPRYQRAILIGFTLLIYSLQGYTNVLAVDQIISEQEGKTVIVPCPVNKDKCGELHSLNWFKGDNRIAAMLLDDSNVTSVAEEFEDRVSVEQNPFRLIIRNLQISDEDIYLCDTTYFIPIETCDNFNGHRVELNVLVPPSEVVILDEKGDRIENGSIVGPMQERQTLKATCIVKNTRPQPQVGWWRGNKRLTTHSPSYDEKDGLFTATLELSLQLSRDDLGHSIECRAESAAIQNTIKNYFSVDLQVRPTTVTINGVEHHTVQGSKVVLTCDVHGARPPVNLTWFNASQPMDPKENDLMEIRTRAFEKEDGTYHTQSDLIFNASRFENDVKFVCQAENIVLQINREAPMQSLLTLEVLYPPVVKVSPPEITVNTSDTVLLNCEYVANPASLDQVVWYRNGEVVNVNDTERYEGGNSENVALVIRSTEKQDIGNYTCQLSNSIGKGVSEQQIDLDVQYVPIVEVLMIPEGPVKESDESNVTLFCNIIDANPSVLTKVRWYANSTLLKELPDCEETREDLCHIDPSKLLLESIGRGFFYNYSCEGYNAAGWGPRSEDKELLVHYEPGPATLTHFPLIAVKKKSVTFSCSVDDPGYPETNRYRWLRGGRGPLQDIVTKDWTVEPVGLDSRTNYSCYAFNEGGKGVMATVNLEVHAPPFFIKNLKQYTGMLHTARNANLTCRIECVPRCEISWLKDGVPIEKNDTRYFVKDKYMDASPATGDFESMLSVLHFNMSNWPSNKFDIEGDNANYTCVSTGNTVGPGIKSFTYFGIEYAPDNTTVSEEVVYVQEDTIPGRVICKSRANPEPSYEWHFNNKTVVLGNALIINKPMTRNDTGRYTCVAWNKHGNTSVDTFIDVQYKPRCEIERQEIEEKDTLICTAYGNPEEADFSWSIKGENETVEWLGNGDHKAFKDKSYYVLKEDYAIARTYRCVANNTAGVGTFCEIEVAVRLRKQLAWWQRWDKTTLIILVASILILLLAVIIICCIIICICRRRRRQDKSVQEKSSSMADPLTEPGEYENLPFHGLQTAPNKFTTPTTPTNFNNNTNVVRSVPRPKRLNGNISQNTIQATGAAATTTQANYYDENETDIQHQQQYYQQQQQQQYSTMPYNRQHQTATTVSAATLSGMQTLIPNSSITSNGIGIESGIIVHNNNSNNNSTLQHQQQNLATTTSTNPHQMTYNLNNCFPKSYTEYYHQQQQQQQQQHHQFPQKFNNSNLINAIEHDFNTYAVVERQQPPVTASVAATNPFLAVSNFKKFDTSGDEDLAPGNYQTASMKRQGKRKTFADKLEDKRFYSLKFSSHSNKQKQQNKSSTAAAALNINHSFNGGSTGGGGVLGSLLSSNKCKRHHSFAGGSLGDIDPKGPGRNPHMNFYDPPAYENVNDAVQVHSAAVSDMELPDSGLNGSAQTATATVLLHPLPYGIAGGSQGPKKKHHQRQHQPKEDLNLIEPERLSIYRSDSGISNSSYECVTPFASNTQTPGSTPPPGKMPRTPKTPKTPKGHKNQTLAHTAVTAHFNSSHKKQAPRVPPTPLYMNVNDQPTHQQHAGNNISNLERPSSPSSTMATSAYESASSSQNDNTCNDPISLSSTTSLYSGGGGNKSSLTAVNQRCNRHQQPPDITTPEEFEQYQLGHHVHAHSASSLSVASSVSASGSNAGGRVKCKKQQQRLNGQGVLTNHMELNKRKTLANNPFLATNTAAATTTTCHKKLHRRQTISDPYAHIKHINECRRQSNYNANIYKNSICRSSSSSNGNNNTNNKTHYYCTKSANAFKATTAAAATTTTNDTQSSTAATNKSQQQQVGLQQYNKTKQPSSSLSHTPTFDNATTAKPTTSCHQYATTYYQQQMLMHKNVVNNCKNISNDNTRHVADNKNRGDSSLNQPHRSLNCDVALNVNQDDNDDNVDNVDVVGVVQKQSQNKRVVKGGHNRSMSNTTNYLQATTTTTTTLLQDNKTTTNTLGFMERPVKLPLRKYHSFHFQPTQTVTGQQICKLQQLKQQHLQQSTELQESSAVLSSPGKTYAQLGPLVFRPYNLDEDKTFKPIQPSEESEDSIDYVREYVGTVEKFLKDEEKYMDSGDFTNLTQRLKQQQDFLNSANSSEREDLKESLTFAQQSDSEPNSLYEVIAFKPNKEMSKDTSKSLETDSIRIEPQDENSLRKNFPSNRVQPLRESRQDFSLKNCNLREQSTSPKFHKQSFSSNKAESLRESDYNSQHFITPSRALNLLKTVIESDQIQSDEEKLSPEKMKTKVADNSSLNILQESKRSVNSSKHCSSSNTVSNRADIYSEVKRSDSQKSLKSPKVSTLSYKALEPLDNEKFPESLKSSNFSSLLRVRTDKENNIILPSSSRRGTQEISYDHINTLQLSSAIDENKNSYNSFLYNSPSNTPQKLQISQNNTLRNKRETEENPVNSTMRSSSLLSCKALLYPQDSLDTPKDSHLPSTSVLSKEELEKVFKPYEQQKSTKFLNEFENSRPVSTALNPAASLEALELLTKSNPELWSSNQAGSRHNLHQLELFHTLQQQKSKQMEDEEDLGYSFCEDENDDEEEEEVGEQQPPNSPQVKVIMDPNKQSNTQVKYVLTQSHREVHI